MPKIIFTAKKALKDYNKKSQDFAEIQGRMRKLDNNLNPLIPSQPTLDDQLRAQNMPVTFSVKQAIAKKMNMDYKGTPQEDMQILNAMNAQSQNQEMSKQGESEKGNADREHALKEREMALKEKQAEHEHKAIKEQKMPTSDEIADKILKKFNS